MSIETCSSDPCTKLGGLSCAGCRTTKYCSKECQKAHWKQHKLSCLAARTQNCYLLHPPPNGDFGDVSTHIEPFHLSEYGNESEECRELRDRLGWEQPKEVGKFYDHLGSDEWYYFVYADGGAKAAGKPLNAFSKRLCYKGIYGDLAVLRSGPIDSVYPELFNRSALAHAVEFYKTKSRSQVFGEREKNRGVRKYGLDPNMMPFHLHI